MNAIILLIPLLLLTPHIVFVKATNETINGPNGISGTLTVPPGSVIKNFSITQNLAPSFSLANSTWVIHNSTSGSTGTITFKEV